MQNTNYSLILQNTIKDIEKLTAKPRLLLHVCCAPCSSYVLEYLNAYFDITAYYYNPNISPEKEYLFRADELVRFITETAYPNVKPEIAEYTPQDFREIAKGLENEPEGGKRCLKCYEMRLRKTAEKAKTDGYDYFTTTLTISPMKNSQIMNDIGRKVSEEIGIPYLFSDFKKKNGYKRSCELSKQFGLYRQNYCGCEFSKSKPL